MTVVCCHNTNSSGRRLYYTNRLGTPIEPTKTIVTRLETPRGLTGLARFLADHVPATHNHRGALMVRVYNDRITEGDLLRAQGRSNADAMIRAYDLDNKPAMINDWCFPVLNDGESPESFWKRAAEEMTRSGVTRVAVDDPIKPRAEYRV